MDILTGRENNMKKLVTVIVPIYNVENYLKKCVNSIINQTYENIEIILIDDGSTDGSGTICDEYLAKDNRIKVIHKKNEGLSKARNVGIEISNGDFITFIDSDDYFDTKFIENMLKIAVESKADLIISGLKDVFEKQKNIYADESDYYTILSKEETYRKVLLQEEIDVSANAKLYQKEIFKNIRYPVGELYEDIKIIDKIIENANKIVYTKYKGYFYLQRNGSIMHSKINKEKFVLLKTIERLLEFIEEKYPNVKNAAIKRYVYCNYHILGRAIFNKDLEKECKKIRKNILKYRKEIFEYNIFSLKEKIATVTLILGIWNYKVFWKIYCKIYQKL